MMMSRLISIYAVFDSQSFYFTYKRIFRRYFVKKNKADDKCSLIFGAERVQEAEVIMLNKIIRLKHNVTDSLFDTTLSGVSCSVCLEN